MFIRTATVLIPATALAALVAFPVSGAAQDAGTLLDSLRLSIGKEFPTRLRITGAGSEYAAGAGEAGRKHHRIGSYTQELDLGSSTASERVVRVDEPAGGGTRNVTASSPWLEQYALWTNPVGFLAGAASQPATIASETLFGTPYRVISFTPAGGRPVRGYVTEDNVLERIRTQVDGREVESVLMSWQDFDGLTFPSLIIQKENDEVARILIVEDVVP
jgi:hypothetical protein